MKILTALTYYRPHISGLTIYAERVCQALAERGHQVTVLTSHYDHNLPLRETRAGVSILRVPVAMRISKGVIMPAIGWQATRLALSHDVLHLHLPQFDSPGFALRGWLLRKPVVLTYHSDLTLPPSPFHWLVEQVVKAGNHAAVRLADAVVTNTRDFAEHSPFLSQYQEKVHAIFPPVQIEPPTAEAVCQFREKFNLPESGPLIGIVARLSAEKGFEYLLEALPSILAQFPNALILHAGPREPVGEAAYAARLAPLLAQFAGRYRHLGILPDADLAAFFSACDVHVLPSVNNTESFGMVQIEAALCGTPTVASDLPGVRVAVQQTGMGLTVPPRDPQRLAGAICFILSHPADFSRPQMDIASVFSPQTIAAQYEALFEVLLGEKK